MARLHRRMARLHTQSDITVTYHVFAWGIHVAFPVAFVFLGVLLPW